MKDILEDILAHKRIEVEKEKTLLPPQVLYPEAEKRAVRTVSMKKALEASRSGIIAEYKRKSPSKGWIREDGRPDVIPASYAAHGAAAVSILTDRKFFGGDDDFLRTARPAVDIPILRKEFVIDGYQLYQARAMGADAVLLIAAALSVKECSALCSLAHSLSLEVLLEIHEEDELDYISCGPDMVGVNNRDLGTFHTDTANSFRLAGLLPGGLTLVSESGISKPGTVRELRKAGFRGFLIGEAFMRSPDPGEALEDFIRQVLTDN